MKTHVLEYLACNFIKKKLQHRCFPVNFAKLLRTDFFIEQLSGADPQILRNGGWPAKKF